jgi:hypothetical protein
MATVEKAFRIKNGLVVEGATATIAGSNVLTEASTEFLQDTTGAMFTGGTFTGITFTYNDETGVISGAVSATPTFADKIIFEGVTPDDFQTTLQVIDPTEDQTITLPNATTTLVGKDTTDTFTNKTFNTAATGNVLQINGNTINAYTGTGSTVVLNNGPTIAGGITLSGSTTGSTIIQAAATAAGTITFPAVTGTVVTTGDTGTVTNTMLAGSIANDKLTNSSVTVNSKSVSLGGSTTLITDDIAEAVTSPTNLWFTDARARGAITGSTGITYNATSGTIAIDSTVATTSGSQTLSNKTISATNNTITVSSTNVSDFDEASVDAVAAAIAAGTQTNITITYNDEAGSLSFNASGGVSSLTGTANEVDVSASTGAVTIGLPDNITIAGNVTISGTPTSSNHAVTKLYVDEIAQGLHVHASAETATTNNISLSPAPAAIDGVTLTNGMRVLVKNQSTTSENGIYTYASTSTSLVRAADYDAPNEIQAGDFIFVSGGTVNGSTGWVQTNTVGTIGVDPIVFTQFSGAGTYLAGNGLTLTGNTFSINTGVTVDLNTGQTLTNKTLTSPTISNPTVSGLYLSDNEIVIEGDPDTSETRLVFTNPTDDRTITFKDASGTVAFTGDIETAIDGFGNAVTGGTGISTSYAATSNILTINNTGVTSLAGTANQITASASTGSVTLSLPQSIASTSSPTFAGLSVGTGSLTAGSLLLTDALLGTATTSISGTSATVIDSWAVTSYNSAKYIVQMKNGNDIEVLEVLVTVDGNNNVYLTEYADIQSNVELGTTSADYLSGNVRLLVTSTSGTVVKVHKTLIEA